MPKQRISRVVKNSELTTKTPNQSKKRGDRGYRESELDQLVDPSTLLTKKGRKRAFIFSSGFMPLRKDQMASYMGLNMEEFKQFSSLMKAELDANGLLGTMNFGCGRYGKSYEEMVAKLKVVLDKFKDALFLMNFSKGGSGMREDYIDDLLRARALRLNQNKRMELRKKGKLAAKGAASLEPEDTPMSEGEEVAEESNLLESD
jgi:hypothetical protein